MKLLAIVTVFLIGYSSAADCDFDQCKLPDCRCFTDTNNPGGLSPEEIPQMVVITMDYVLNTEYDELYNDLFAETTNPNDCPIRGTFFIQDSGTNYDVVKDFNEKGFEIGINSIDGTSPNTADGFSDIIKVVRDNLTEKGGVNAASVLGYRAPQLSAGGDEMFIAIAGENLLYDCSCSSKDYSEKETLKWPFTYDYDFGKASCTGGLGVSLEFAGKWQVIIGEFTFNDRACATPQSCLGVETQDDAFTLLYEAFEKHYDGERSPFVIPIDPVWMLTDYKRAGLKEFIEYIRAAFDDIWIVTQYQALQWVQNPTPLAEINDFEPFKCNQNK